MMSNPYTSRGPLHETSMFYGRRHELNEIGGFIRGNQSVSVVGPRKMGKTSLMLHLMRNETRTALQMGNENLFVYLDCQALSSCQYDEIFTYFCTEMALALRARKMEPESALKAAVSKPSRSAFESALRRLNQRGLRVILILDEFEQIAINSHLDVNFFNALRSAASRLRLVFLTASARPLIELTYSDRTQTILSSPFFNIFAPVFLGLLSESESRNLIRAPMETGGIVVSPKLEDFIYNLVGGHPLALQIACFYAWDKPHDLKFVEQQAVQELEAHFQYYWHNLSPTEQDVVRDPSTVGLREADDPALRVILRDLTRKCLLLQARGKYDYPSKAWAGFVSAQPADSAEAYTIERPSQIEPVQPQSLGSTEAGKTKDSFKEVLKDSVSEIIGGLVVALVGGIVWLLYHWGDEEGNKLKDIFSQINWGIWMWVMVGILVVGITARQIAFRRKRSK